MKHINVLLLAKNTVEGHTVLYGDVDNNSCTMEQQYGNIYIDDTITNIFQIHPWLEY